MCLTINKYSRRDTHNLIKTLRKSKLPLISYKAYVILKYKETKEIHSVWSLSQHSKINISELNYSSRKSTKLTNTEKLTQEINLGFHSFTNLKDCQKFLKSHIERNFGIYQKLNPNCYATKDDSLDPQFHYIYDKISNSHELTTYLQIIPISTKPQDIVLLGYFGASPMQNIVSNKILIPNINGNTEDITQITPKGITINKIPILSLLKTLHL